MRITLSRPLLAAAVCGALLASNAAAAQATAERGRAIGSVIHHRLHYLADPIPFDACTVRKALGADDFATIAAQVRGTLDDASSPCPREPRRGRTVVLVDSIQFGAPAVYVYLTVLRGELIHRENYTLNPASAAAFMPVREVRLWGHSQAYAGRAPRPGAHP